MRRKLRTAVASAVVAGTGAVAGILTAQALGEVGLPTVSLPTVSVPLPTTTVAPPPAPPLPPPPPPPGPPAPTVTVPPAPPVPSLPPARPPPSVHGSSAPGSTAPSGSSGPSRWPGSSASSGPSGSPGTAVSSGSATGAYASASASPPRRPSSARASRARVVGIRVRPVRVTRGGRRLQAARITFMLSRPARVLFVARGPAPSCRVAARFSVRGERGVNHVRFTGRVGRRALPSGTYRITARIAGRAPSGPVVVVIGAPGTRDRFSCRPTAIDFASMLSDYSSAESDSPAGFVNGSGTGGGQEEAESEGRGVLPAVTDRLRRIPEALPTPKPPAPAPPSWLLGMGALVLLLMSALALGFYVLHFLRRADS